MARILPRGKAGGREDARLQALLSWLPVETVDWQPVTGDASRRRYFRIHTPTRSFIAMDAPPPEQPRRFVQVAELMRSAGIRVPRIHAVDLERGFVLLEDFGDRTYLAVLSDGSADALYRAALDTLLRLQTGIDPATCGLPSYTGALLRRELAIFRDWLLHRWLDEDVNEGLWNGVVELLVANALEQPQVCVHRDYHSRNLMHLPGGPGVLDFQDAVVGPVTYDLVSLLRDCYICWPEDRVGCWLEEYRLALSRNGLTVDPGQWQVWFDLMGAQRHLKAAGIFARLWLRDRRAGYLADIPRTLAYVIRVCRRYPRLWAFSEYLTQRILPQVEVRL
ncbi:MAG TPA: aminoglycoside phosphotransferase [Methylothermaceae bacterium]|nr:aminoglycoside phosphotransferase [Methylothermaceae bacterium]